MRFAINYQPAHHGLDPEAMVSYAQHAESCGFEGIYLPEHLALSTDGPIPAAMPFLDPLDCLTFIAAHTSRLLLGTGVLLLPYHHPVPLAKRLTTLDLLSHGRLRLLTIGVGALPDEAAAAGVDFTTRGRRADEAIEVLRLLWSGGPVSFAGEFFSFPSVSCWPRPAGGGLPIHVGGSSRAAARRAGRLGVGYFAGGALSPDERAAQLVEAHSAAASAGHDPAAFEYTRWGAIDMPQSTVDALAAQGVTRLVVSATTTEPAAQRDELSAFAERFGLGGAGH